MRDVLAEYERLTAAGELVGRGVVTSVWGSAPRPEGSTMLATRTGVVVGSVSGGCVESATADEIAADNSKHKMKKGKWGDHPHWVCQAPGCHFSTLREEQSRAAAPTYANLGERIGTILSLADEEADERDAEEE